MLVGLVSYSHGGGYSYRLCPAEETITESCFQAHHLEFEQDKQQLLFANGSRIPVPAPVFVNTGTSPPGATWSRLPLPGTGYGHRCACDLTDDAHGDHPQDYNCGCKKGEEQGGCSSPGNCSSGACLPCPETAGSDCSRCDNPPRHSWGHYSFPPPCDEACMRLNPGVLDEVRIPAHFKPGKYVLGFRYVPTCTRCMLPFPCRHRIGSDFNPTDRAAQIRLRCVLAGQFVPTVLCQIVMTNPPAPLPSSLAATASATTAAAAAPLLPKAVVDIELLCNLLFFSGRCGAIVRTWSWLPKPEPVAEPTWWTRGHVAVKGTSARCSTSTCTVRI